MTSWDLSGFGEVVVKVIKLSSGRSGEDKN